MSDSFKKIGLIGKFANTEIGDHLRGLASYLLERQREVAIDLGTAENLKIDMDNVDVLDRNALGEQCDLVIVIGGDGTMLNAARSLAKFDVPLIGINLGHLGFLTDIPWELYQSKLESILAGEFTMEKRLLLKAEIIRDGAVISENIAFNDVVVHKWEEARMLQFDTHIDDRFVNTQRADGLIISTPTGSTAYALSGGGPILYPNMLAIALVPICPHTLSQRPIVLPSEQRIEIQLNQPGSAGLLSFDGHSRAVLNCGDRIVVTRHQKNFTLLHPAGYDYFHILRAKLKWSNQP